MVSGGFPGFLPPISIAPGMAHPSIKATPQLRAFCLVSKGGLNRGILLYSLECPCDVQALKPRKVTHIFRFW